MFNLRSEYRHYYVIIILLIIMIILFMLAYLTKLKSFQSLHNSLETVQNEEQNFIEGTLKAEDLDPLVNGILKTDF